MVRRFMIAAALAAGASPAFAQMPLPLRDGAPAAQPSQGGTSTAKATSVADHALAIQRYGKIVGKQPLGAGGLTAWTVEKNGRRVVLYTTNDGQAVISGIVWDTKSGKNLSDPVIATALNGITVQPQLGAAGQKPAPVAAMPEVAVPPVGALVGKYTGKLPESIKTVDSLAGIKEGKGGPADTLYVVFDPRCPYCRLAYTRTRPYVKRGFSIKWIPAIVLGNPDQGKPLAATIMQAAGKKEQDEALRRVLGNKENLPTAPTKKTLEALALSESFFFAAFQNNNVETVGVPAAFFLDKRTGQARMMTGVSEMPIIEEIFGKLPN